MIRLARRYRVQQDLLLLEHPRHPSAAIAMRPLAAPGFCQNVMSQRSTVPRHHQCMLQTINGSSTHASTGKVLGHHVCGFLLVDKNDDWGLILPAVENFEQALSMRREETLAAMLLPIDNKRRTSFFPRQLQTQHAVPLYRQLCPLHRW